ncbi:metal ABC transporter solute-binding protein, Zn/Mn family [Candidatus Poriferisodalis sp.]|uniref:metal ABC transporter solute-binding protein, Zn/Mn family n=1 Tax=Candidatus Poriferisodalis sp. TaxID=3101277 RepID=UPI003B02D486
MTVEAGASRQRRRRIRKSGLVVAAAAALFAAACTGTDAETDAADATDASSAVPLVVTTTSIWGDVVSNVGCEDSVSVTTLIPQGGDPHTFEPSLRDRETMDAADLVVVNGLGLEERLEDTLEAVAAEGVHVFEVAEHIDTIEFEFSGGHDDHGHDDHDEEDGHDDHDEDDAHEDDHDEEDGHDDHDEEDGHDDHDEEDGHDDHDEDDAHEDDHDEEDGHDDHDEEDGHEDDHDEGHDEDGHDDHEDDDHGHMDDDHADEDDHGHDHSGGDPHVWLDPQRVAGVLGELADELIHAGADADTVNRCLDSYREALEDADAEIAEILDAVPADRRILITNHDAFGYFADRYGFEIVGTVIPSLSTAAETNPALLEELAEIIEHEGVPAVFSETTHSDADIQALATAAGNINVVQLLTGSLAPEGEDGDTLIGMLRFNAQAIADALG